jgi:hypothetical protein
MVPAAAVIPSLIAFSYVVAVKKLVAFSSMRVTLRKSECSNQGHCCTLQQRMTSLRSDAENAVYGSAGLIVFVGDR